LKRALLVSLSITLAASFLFTTPGCKKAEKSTSSVTSQTTSSTSPLGKGKDLGGREISVAAWWDLNPAGDTATGAAELDRIKQVESKYNCKIKYNNIFL
jgi:multiple sugar transport system substrate-binding protein